MHRPRLYIADILRWADEFRQRCRRWPHRDDGRAAGAPDLTWRQINSALSLGNRGLPCGSSLAQLLAARRGRRHQRRPPALFEGQILAWADAHHARTGDWPTDRSGPIPGGNGETWRGVDKALRVGRRGLAARSSLARLLA